MREVSLTGAAGEPVTFKDFGGDLVLVFFGYTRCPDVCPVTLARLAKMYRDLGEPEDIRVVMVSVDPANDTPEIAQRYAAVVSSRVCRLWAAATRKSPRRPKLFLSATERAARAVAHTDAVLLVDREGYLKAVYGQANLETLPGDLAALGARASGG